MIFLSDFPKDKIFILLNEDFREQFFDEIIDWVGTRWQLKKILNVSYSTLKSWQTGKHHRGANKREDVQYCPLWVLDKLSDIYSTINDQKKEASWGEIQQNTFAYRAHSGTRILEPKFPIEESPELFRVVGHIMADGSWTKGATPYYANLEPKLRSLFYNDLNKVFGRVECFESNSNEVTRLYFPTAIIYVLMHKYKVKFSGINCFSKKLLRIPDECKLAFLQALFDDEGYVHDSNIQICSLDLDLLRNIRKMLLFFNIKTSQISNYQHYVRKDGTISEVKYMNIYAASVKEFGNKVGFNHPKKIKQLDLITRIQKRGKYPAEDIEYIILSELRNGPLTARELSLKATITARNLREGYLYPLEEQGKIKNFGKKKGKGGPLLWGLNDGI